MSKTKEKSGKKMDLILKLKENESSSFDLLYFALIFLIFLKVFFKMTFLWNTWQIVVNVLN